MQSAESRSYSSTRCFPAQQMQAAHTSSQAKSSSPTSPSPDGCPSAAPNGSNAPPAAPASAAGSAFVSGFASAASSQSSLTSAPAIDTMWQISILRPVPWPCRINSAISNLPPLPLTRRLPYHYCTALGHTIHTRGAPAAGLAVLGSGLTPDTPAAIAVQPPSVFTRLASGLSSPARHIRNRCVSLARFPAVVCQGCCQLWTWHQLGVTQRAAMPAAHGIVMLPMRLSHAVQVHIR